MRGFFIRSHYCVIVCEVAHKSFFAAALQEKEAYARILHAEVPFFPSWCTRALFGLVRRL